MRHQAMRMDNHRLRLLNRHCAQKDTIKYKNTNKNPKRVTGWVTPKVKPKRAGTQWMATPHNNETMENFSEKKPRRKYGVQKENTKKPKTGGLTE